MIKYLPELSDIVLEEIPNRITLAVEITNCQGKCIACHSPFLRKDIGEPLSFEAASKLIDSNFGVNCFLFLGEGKDQEALLSLAQELKAAYPMLELALFSGREELEDRIYDIFDFVKTGPFIESRGPLNNPNTNQRLYYHRVDITSIYWG